MDYPYPVFSNTSDETARGFIRRFFSPTETVAILALPPRGEGQPEQRFPAAETACRHTYMAWLRHLNAKGYNIYVGVNPFNPQRGRREKQDVAVVRRLQLDLDFHGTQSLTRLLANIEAGTVPQPVGVLSTSKGRYQILWNVEPGSCTVAAAEDMNRRLALEYDGDRSATDCSRVFRLPGFRNKKSTRDDDLVTWADYGGGDTLPADFSGLPAIENAGGSAARADAERQDGETAEELTADGSHGITQSERDWAWCREELRNGADPQVTAFRLEQRRGDKPNPHYYAQRTVDRARVTIEAERSPKRGIER